MAPDRRFGLPHPLDDDSAEGSSREKKTLWDSLRRAFRSDETSVPEPPTTLDSTPIPLPGAPPRVDASGPAPRPETLVERQEVPFLEEFPSEPADPVLAESPPSPAASAPAPTAAPPRPERPSGPSSPTASDGAPRLARGLASFSKSNAEREKRFSHLLHDEPSAKKKSRGRERGK